jgi:hypothetical protein
MDDAGLATASVVAHKTIISTNLPIIVRKVILVFHIRNAVSIFIMIVAFILTGEPIKTRRAITTQPRIFHASPMICTKEDFCQILARLRLGAKRSGWELAVKAGVRILVIVC